MDGSTRSQTTPLPLSTVTVREKELQRLLAEERARSEQRKTNYHTIKTEHIGLQKDFIELQSECKHLLEETVHIKTQKDGLLDQLRRELEDKAAKLEQLRRELLDRDPAVLKEQFKDELQAPLKLLERDKDRLERDNERLTYELKMARQQCDHLDKECVTSVERTRLSYESELNLVRKEKEEIRVKLLELCQSPDAQKTLALNAENTALRHKLTSIQTTLSTADAHYKRIQSQLEQLVSEHDRLERDHQRELSGQRTLVAQMVEKCAQLEQVIRGHEVTSDELGGKLARRDKRIDELMGELAAAEVAANKRVECIKVERERDVAQLSGQLTGHRDTIKSKCD